MESESSIGKEFQERSGSSAGNNTGNDTAGSSGVAPETSISESKPSEPKGGTPGRRASKNSLRCIRIEKMMSKAELARRANLSVLTIDRVEKGYDCRMDTKRKILEALGLSLTDRVRVFGDEE